jgi:hypothetical protein
MPVFDPTLIQKEYNRWLLTSINAFCTAHSSILQLIANTSRCPSSPSLTREHRRRIYFRAQFVSFSPHISACPRFPRRPLPDSVTRHHTASCLDLSLHLNCTPYPIAQQHQATVVVSIRFPRFPSVSLYLPPSPRPYARKEYLITSFPRTTFAVDLIRHPSSPALDNSSRPNKALIYPEAQPAKPFYIPAQHFLLTSTVPPPTYNQLHRQHHAGSSMKRSRP